MDSFVVVLIAGRLLSRYHVFVLISMLSMLELLPRISEPQNSDVYFEGSMGNALKHEH